MAGATEVKETGKRRRTGRRRPGVPPTQPASAASWGETVELKKKAFVQTLRDTFNVAKACDAVGISRVTAYRWRDEDPEFAAAWDAAIEGCLDDIEEAFRRRATRDEKPDTMAGMFLLNGYRAERFKQRTEISGPEGGPLQVVLTLAGGSDQAVAPPGLYGTGGE